MFTNSKICVVIALAGLVIASPAFAQSARSGNMEAPSQVQMTRHSFNNPALTGGGSSGYNWTIRHDA